MSASSICSDTPLAVASLEPMDPSLLFDSTGAETEDSATTDSEPMTAIT